ncbi:MAG: hypothetical protein WDO13_17250 [Verrucomicrobiota bacterium]
MLVAAGALALAACGNKETKAALDKSADLAKQKQYADANQVLVDALQAREAQIRNAAGLAHRPGRAERAGQEGAVRLRNPQDGARADPALPAHRAARHGLRRLHRHPRRRSAGHRRHRRAPRQGPAHPRRRRAHPRPHGPAPVDRRHHRRDQGQRPGRAPRRRRRAGRHQGPEGHPHAHRGAQGSLLVRALGGRRGSRPEARPRAPSGPCSTPWPTPTRR